MKNYIDKEFLGSTLDVVVNNLLRRNELIRTNFNGTYLFSDTVTMDDAYLTITGKTKEEYDKEQQKIFEDHDREEKEHQAKIPELTEEWIKKGHDILAEKYWSDWDICVPIRLGDLYHGFELGCCLDIVKILNDGGALEEAKTKIVNQDHSGMSWGLVVGMVKSFCDRGAEFAAFVKIKS